MATQRQKDSDIDGNGLSARGYEAAYASMRICPHCFELYDLDPPYDLSQRCACYRDRDEPGWPGYDFNERALLCRCCGFEVLRSGSRWSPFFCAPCKERVAALDRQVGQLIIPIGRHTLMNASLMQQKAPTLAVHDFDIDALAADVLDSLTIVSSGSERLWEWYRAQMARTLEATGLAGDVPLRDYLLALPEDETSLALDRFTAFVGMASHFGVAISAGGKN